MGLGQFDAILAFSGVMLTLSLIITVLVQMISDVLCLRASNLQMGLTRLFEQVSPQLGLDKALAPVLAKAVFTHATLKKDTWIGKASAIRPAELLMVLEDIARAESDCLKDEQKKALSAALEKTIPGTSAADSGKAVAVVAELEKLFPASAQSVKEAVSKAFDRHRQIEVEVTAWFDAVMDRTSQGFARWAAVITLLASSILCLGLHIDSLAIFKQLSSNPALSANLAAQSEAMLKESQKTMESTAPKPLATNALLTIKEQLPKDSEIPKELRTYADGERWIREKLPAAEQAAAIDHFQIALQGEVGKSLEERGKEYDALWKKLDSTGLSIVPVAPASYADRHHLLGVLMSIFFLGLGAPFWFNVLKQLSTLRPILARKIEKDKEG